MVVLCYILFKFFNDVWKCMQIVVNVMNEVSIRDFFIFVFVVSGVQYMVYVMDELLVNNNYFFCVLKGVFIVV